MASSILLKFPRNTEVQSKPIDISESLSRVRRPLDSTKINLSVMGIYSLPEVWKAKLEDPVEQMFQYEIEVAGVKVKHSKIYHRELTEAEKAEAEAAKNVKKSAPPAKGKNAPKEEEPSVEELERIAKEKAEKEELERQRQAEWDALDDETKFYRTNEDIFKEPSIRMQNLVQQEQVETLKKQLVELGEPVADEGDESADTRATIQAEIDELTKTSLTGLAICEKSGFELIEFEEAVNQDLGVWLKFMKVPAPENLMDPPPGAKKAAPKGKGPNPDDLKPVFGKAWVSLDDLAQPGATETVQRVFIETIAPAVKENQEGQDVFIDQEEFEQVFEPQRTYVYLRVSLTQPVTPTVPEKPEPQPKEIVPVKQLVRWPFSKLSTDDFCKQVAIAIKALTREYYSMFQNDLERQSKVTMSSQESNEVYEDRKKEFLYEINTQGKYHILKEKMKKTIVRIVREHFSKSESIKGLHKDERDHFYSELYVYLVEQMRNTVSEMVQCEKNELHENVTIPVAQAERERDHLIEKHINENSTQRYHRMAYEEEFLKSNLSCAEQYYLQLLKIEEGDPKLMVDVTKFYLRQNNYEKAESYLRDAYSFDMENKQIALSYACLLCQLNRSQEASVILRQLISEGFESVKVNMLLSIAYQMNGDTFMADKYKAISNLEQLRQLGRLPSAGESKGELEPKSSVLWSLIKPPQPTQSPPVTGKDAKSHKADDHQNETHDSGFAEPLTNQVESVSAYKEIRLTEEEQDAALLNLAEYLLDERLAEFAQNCLHQVSNHEEFNYLHCCARVQEQLHNYEKAIAEFEHMIDIDNTWLTGYVEAGHAYYRLNNESSKENALKQYLKAIRVANLTGKEIKDQLVFQRAGAIYCVDEKWEDARVMFLMCAESYKTAFSYFNLGVASYHLGYFAEAEKVLGLVNYMDPMHAQTWAYLTLVLLKRPNAPLNAAYQTMNEAIKLKLNDSGVMFNIYESWCELSNTKAAQEALEQAILIKAGTKYSKKLLELFDSLRKSLTSHAEQKHSEASLTIKDILLGQVSQFFQRNTQLNSVISDYLDILLRLLCGEVEMGSDGLKEENVNF